MGDALLESLLEVQGHDLVIDQLRHRRHVLEERQALRELAQTSEHLDRQRASLASRAHDLERQQRRVEDEVDSVGARRADSERQLYGGTVRAPRELQALSHEVDALAGRIRALEDDLLELMEAAEPLAAELAGLDRRRQEIDAEAVRLAALLSQREAEIDDLLAAEAAARAAAVASIPPDLMVTYEQLRRRLDGVAVARLEASRCTGCHLALPAVELDAVRRAPADAVVRHEECGRILVR